MAIYQHDYAAQNIISYCLRVNPDGSFSVFGVQTKKAKRWFGLDLSDPNNPKTSVISPADALGDAESYETACDLQKRASALRREYDANLQRLVSQPAA